MCDGTRNDMCQENETLGETDQEEETAQYLHFQNKKNVGQKLILEFNQMKLKLR